MMDRKTKRLLLGEYANGMTIANMATKYKISQSIIKDALREQGVILASSTTELTFRQRAASLERKLSQARMELYREKQKREGAEKRVYQLESEFKRRGIPLP